MRRVLGYVDGKPIWSENQPAYGGSIRWGGTIVVGESSRPPRDRSHYRKLQREKANDIHEERPSGRPRLSGDVKLIGRGFPGYETEEERTAARRKSWRESKQRQRERRAALRSAIESVRQGRAA